MTTVFLFLDKLIIFFSSLSDSTLINKIFFLIAKFSSLEVFPTPENTILFGLKPTFKTFWSSPIETTSAPNPLSFIIFNNFEFELDLTEKHINGFVFSKFL